MHQLRELVGAFNTTKLCAGTCHGNRSLSTRIGATDVFGQTPSPTVSFTVSLVNIASPLGIHCFPQQLTSQQGQTGILLLPLTRSQSFKTVFTVPPSITLMGGWRAGGSVCGVVVHGSGSQRLPDRLVMSAMGAMCCHVCLVFPYGFSKGRCWLAPDGHDT